jgi:hypothetical protein
MFNKSAAIGPKSSVQHCRAVVEDRTIFFEMTAGQFYSSQESLHGEGTDPVPIHWEVGGEVFVGEMSLADINSLDILTERG